LICSPEETAMRIGIWAAGTSGEGARRLGEELRPVAEVVLVTPDQSRGPGVLCRLVSLGMSAKRVAVAARVWAAGSLLRYVLLAVAGLLLLPLALPLILLKLLMRYRPGLHESMRALAHSLRAGSADGRLVREAECDVWAVLSPDTSFPFPTGVPCVWLLDGPVEGDALETLVSVSASPALNSVLFAATDPAALLAQSGPGGMTAVHWRHRPLAVGWAVLLAEAAGLPATRPVLAAKAGPRPVRVHLFLPEVYRGGVWVASLPLLAGLSAVNRRRGQATFTLAVLPGQRGLDELARIAPDVPVETLTPQDYGQDGYYPYSPSAPRADVWLSLIDRFHLPLRPPVPLAVIVYDVLQRFAPEVFAPDFFTRWVPAMRATARHAVLITTNPVNRINAALEYGLRPEDVALIEEAWDPAVRFAGLEPAPAVAEAPDGFMLNITNTTPHKGLACVLRACAAGRARGGPALVVTGQGTDRAVPGAAVTDPSHADLQRLVVELGLVPGRDVWLLGYTDDRQLLDLMSRCGAVVNASQHDNGSLSMIEARYFGKRAISSDYPAAVAKHERFDVPAEYFPVGDHQALATLMLSPCPSVDAQRLAAIRRALADPRLSNDHYAERYYDLLLAMARGTAVAKAA